jgi:hypothetical protein
LIETARVEGGLAWLLGKLGVRFVQLSAGQWRSDVIGRASPSDDEIEACLRQRVRGIPSPPVLSKQALVHALDALGVAYAAAHQPGKQLALAIGRKRP